MKKGILLVLGSILLLTFPIKAQENLPGCRTLHITPYLGNLDWADGSFPTPFGTVYIRHQKTDDGIIVSKIIAPENVRIIQESE